MKKITLILVLCAGYGLSGVISLRIMRAGVSQQSNLRQTRFGCLYEASRDDEYSELTPEPINIATYVFDEKEELKRYAAKVGIEPVRFISYNLLALVLALGANFLGVTSTIMSNTNPEYFRSLQLDQLYAIGGYRRYSSPEQKYSFIYPSSWEQDRAVLAQKLRLRELPASLQKPVGNTGPDVALGPSKGSIPRSNRNNVSVIKSKVLPGFSLKKTLGEPQEAAEFLLKNSIAPPTSGKTYSLLNAHSKGEEYIFEYIVQKVDAYGKPVFNQHSISVIANRGTDLYTCTVVAPEQDWVSRADAATVIAESFQVACD